jgi:hypothetical protein
MAEHPTPHFWNRTLSASEKFDVAVLFSLPRIVGRISPSRDLFGSFLDLAKNERHA